MCAIVARGAVVGVSAAREAARVLRREEGEDRLGFSPRVDLDGEKGCDNWAVRSF